MADFSVNGQAECPHCGRAVQFAIGGDLVLRGGAPRGEAPTGFAYGGAPTGYALRWVQCPACKRVTIVLERQELPAEPVEQVIYPLCTQRPPVPAGVPAAIKADYEESALILPLSPKGSAALSRRCLQAVLVDAGKATKKTLSGQIDEVRPTLPAYLEEELDQVRTIGNFSAHPLKDTNSGAIVEVEPNEAEWNLDVLDDLFDFYYVKPAAIQRRKDLLNQKLIGAGKPTI